MSNDESNTEIRGGKLLKDWEVKFLLILMILMIMLTIIDLNLSFDQVLKFIIR